MNENETKYLERIRTEADPKKSVLLFEVSNTELVRLLQHRLLHGGAFAALELLIRIIQASQSARAPLSSVMVSREILDMCGLTVSDFVSTLVLAFEGTRLAELKLCNDITLSIQQGTFLLSSFLHLESLAISVEISSVTSHTAAFCRALQNDALALKLLSLTLIITRQEHLVIVTDICRAIQQSNLINLVLVLDCTGVTTTQSWPLSKEALQSLACMQHLVTLLIGSSTSLNLVKLSWLQECFHEHPTLEKLYIKGVQSHLIRDVDEFDAILRWVEQNPRINACRFRDIEWSDDDPERDTKMNIVDQIVLTAKLNGQGRSFLLDANSSRKLCFSVLEKAKSDMTLSYMVLRMRPDLCVMNKSEHRNSLLLTKNRLVRHMEYLKIELESKLQRLAVDIDHVNHELESLEK